MIRLGESVEEIAQIFDRATKTLRSRLFDAGWDPDTGHNLAGITPTRDVDELIDLGAALQGLAEADWIDSALCAQSDPEAFYPEMGGSTRQAKNVCVSCPVRAECLDYALDNNEHFGIWGGLSNLERRTLNTNLRELGQPRPAAPTPAIDDTDPGPHTRGAAAMSIDHITPADRFAVVKHLSKGKTPDVVASTTGLGRHEVVAGAPRDGAGGGVRGDARRPAAVERSPRGR